MRTLELLAPAKNLECGIAAIDHGADAVYIGASRFGARAAAGNSIEDIKQLCDYAHQFGAKVHVTVNTIIYDDELDDTLKMVQALDEIGVDALLLQDMGLLAEIKARHLWSRELHSSTQCDTRTADKARWLANMGFQRIVLARELSLDEIAEIHHALPDRDLEVFVHGALCVSYSGVCYASEKCFGRSANRGECAQFCRMKFNLLDADGREIEHQRYLLSLKDLCQVDHLLELADAGASSFKIEGRLKDINYVKNVVAAYSQKLDELVAQHPKKYCRASRGHVDYTFEPNLKKTFNRGFTNYFLKGRQPDIASFDTPKAIGEYVGKVKEIRGNISFNVATVASFANGDGLCFINDDHELEGFRVNRVEGNRLYPLRMPEHLRPGMPLYRNNDRAFEALLAHKTAERRMPITIRFRAVDGGFEAVAFEGRGTAAREMGMAKVMFEHQPAKKPQRDNIVRQLTKLGNTPYVCEEVEMSDEDANLFVPSSLLSDLRRMLVDNMDRPTQPKVLSRPARTTDDSAPVQAWQPAYKRFGYLYNIANSSARDFYESHGLEKITPAFELRKDDQGEALLMQCRHCIRYSLGYCVKRGGQKPTWKEPLYLELGDGRRFRLEFVCKECHMEVFS